MVAFEAVGDELEGRGFTQGSIKSQKNGQSHRLTTEFKTRGYNSGGRMFNGVRKAGKGSQEVNQGNTWSHKVTQGYTRLHKW